MSGFCPRCGVDAKVTNVSKGRYVGDTEKLRVTSCDGCGCRTSWYGDGSVRIWSHGGVMGDVPRGVLIVTPGEEV